MVGINEREGFLVEFEALHRAGERDPELLVELAESEKVGGGLKGDLVEAAGAIKFLDVRESRRHRWREMWAKRDSEGGYSQRQR